MNPFIESFNRGETVSRNVHMGYWEPVSCAPAASDMEEAKRSLNQLAIELCDIADNQTIVDLGCGLGGTIEDVDRGFEGVRLIGVNRSFAELTVCATMEPSIGNSLHWVCSDATGVCLPGGIADRVLCIEAMPHFRSRAALLEESARILRPSGSLVLTDVLLSSQALAPSREASAPVIDLLIQGFGTWPAPTEGEHDIERFAAAFGFRHCSTIDLTAAIMPSFAPLRLHEPPPRVESRFGSASRLLAQLFRRGDARYVCSRFCLLGAPGSGPADSCNVCDAKPH